MGVRDVFDVRFAIARGAASTVTKIYSDSLKIVLLLLVTVATSLTIAKRMSD